jgi:hypothetical protein
MGVATDSNSQEKTDYTSETLRIEHNNLPEITINTPSSQGDIADDSYVIRWQATDSDPEVKVEEGLNPWIYSIPVIAAVGGIAVLLRRMRGSGGDDEDEFEWD